MIHNFTIKRLLRLAPTMIVVVILMPALAVTAQASPRDRNQDGISDRWEKRHRLPLNVNQSRKDQDHDGVVNICEVQAGDNPRRRDSDRDGRRDGAEDADGDGLSNRKESAGRSDCGSDDSDDDGLMDADENSGRIVSFDGTVLTIQSFSGVTLTGTVGPGTKIECGGDDNDDVVAPTPPAVGATSVSKRDPVEHDDDAGDDAGDDKGEGCDDDSSSGDKAGSNHAAGDDRDDDYGRDCGPEVLVPGAVVHESSIIDGVFAKIELAG